MQIVADLHLHSKYSRAVSKDMVLPTLALWGKKKGIDLIGTADWTHPLWFKELETQLEEDGKGVYKVKGDTSSTRFLLTGEIANIYTKGNKGRRIHTVFMAPSLATAGKINEELKKRGGNLMSDGRPILGFNMEEMCELVWGIDEEVLVVPAHIWTPWFSMFGSKSGFDSVEECFGKYADKIYAVETGLSCYDAETEVLTDKGWKKFTEVKSLDKICTLQINTNEIEYQNPNKIFQYKYRGKMYRLKTKRVDLLVTPNHKLLYSPCDFRNLKPYRLKTADELFNKSKRFKKDGIWKGRDRKYFILPGVKMKHGSRFYSGYRFKQSKKIRMVEWVKFFGFWIAEGWVHEGKNGDYNVCVANNNRDLLMEMKKLLTSFSFSVFDGGNMVRVRDYQLFSYLKQFGKSGDKFVPIEIKSLSKELLTILLDYYLKGDGHIYGRNGKGLSATTASIRLRDDLQELALKTGMSAYYKLGSRKGQKLKGLRSKYRQNYDVWVVYFIRKNEHIVLPCINKKYGYIEKWEKLNDYVYCVSVPNKVVYVRRNGIPVWCGNSDPLMNWRIKDLDKRAIVSFSDAHSPKKLGREATVLELKGDKLEFKDVVSALKQDEEARCKIAYTIEFHPEEGKYHYTGHRACGVVQSPEETRKKGTTCHVCGRPLTVGVEHRVDELALRQAQGKPIEPIKKVSNSGVVGYYHPEDKNRPACAGRPPYVMLVPLQEILGEALGVGVLSKRVDELYEQMISGLGTELDILLKTDLDLISKLAGGRVAEGVKKVRSGEMVVKPGYDGVFGVVKIWSSQEELINVKSSLEQQSLF